MLYQHLSRLRLYFGMSNRILLWGAYIGEGEKGINKDYGIKAIITNETLLVQAKYEEGKISFL